MNRPQPFVHESRDASAMSTEPQIAAENVFSTHKRSLEVMTKERDGWKELCDTLIAKTEAGFDTTVCNKCRTHAEGRRESPPRNTRLNNDRMSNNAKTINTVGLQSPAVPVLVSGVSLEQHVEGAIGRLQDDVKDLQIRLAAKQKDCDEERRKAELWQSKYETQQSFLKEVQNENEKHTRDERDVGVKMELHARERENKGKC